MGSPWKSSTQGTKIGLPRVKLRTRTTTNTNPNDTEANAAGKIASAYCCLMPSLFLLALEAGVFASPLTAAPVLRVLGTS